MVTCGHPERYKYSCQIRSFNRLLQALVGESSLQAKSMEFSHMDFSLKQTKDLEILLKITEIDIKLVELEKKQRKANRKRRRMRVQWTRDWIMRRRTLFGQYDLCLGLHCLLLDLSLSLAPGILTRRVLVLGLLLGPAAVSSLLASYRRCSLVQRFPISIKRLSNIYVDPSNAEDDMNPPRSSPAFISRNSN